MIGRSDRTPARADDIYWFVGGPLDGRVQKRPASCPAPASVRYIYLHDGPKIVHHYDLTEVAGHGGEYRLRENCASRQPEDDAYQLHENGDHQLRDDGEHRLRED